ncbi:hypothetical protein [Culicoidibacter larvae]|uniref:Uncharacterized protein n=1 Tax=Culicoidibacter larvae TaxID=2579976 RepID=A0A5R8QG83_9FIRM|nr:hypothetical protein [Culicoidibacter larvae]TLG76710.1 hypothetical protein FEZ08_03590 [Culicoidibacter larvae]
MVGTWKILDTPECKLPEKLSTAFNDLLDMDGAGYKPMLYAATQLVAGTNHLIICKQTIVAKEPIEFLVYVIIYEDLEGNFVLTRIERIV